MTTRYTFTCENFEDNQTVTLTFDTGEDTWSSVDGPMYKFFSFLKGNDFIFGQNSMIGIMTEDGTFIPAAQV